MNIKLSITLALSSLVVACGGPTEKKDNTDMKASVGIDLNNLDKSVKPGDNFFDYANGGWLKANPIPDEYSRYGAFEVLGKKNQEEIKSIIKEVSTKTDIEKGNPEQQIRDFYNSGMDTNRIEELGMKPIEGIINEIEGINSKAELINMQAKLNMQGSYPLFVVYSSQDEKHSTEVIANLSQGGLGLPDRDYYTKEDERSKGIRAEYVNHIQKMFVLAGDAEEVAASKAKNIMDFETTLANASMTMLERRDPHATYNIRTIEELSNETQGYNIKAYLDNLGLGTLESANVHQPVFFKEMAKAFEATDISTLKDYFVWNILNSNANSLSSDFVNQNFYFYSTVLSGVDKMRPRWKRIISATNGSLGDPVGKLYVEKYFPASSKERMVELVGNLRIALKESIQNLDWMTDETKLKAEEKLAAINLKVGYPNKWLDYSKVDITPDNYVQNKWNCTEFSYKRNLAKIGKPVDREEWGMNPQTVNAYYSPNMNEIVFPAAILQPPFFDPNADDAVNYGAIGVVIGHEMTHGFDDQGRQYDKDGNLNNWWTEKDAENFKAKTQILIDEYNNYKVLDSLPVNGELTLGENIADNGGLFIAYAALQKAYEQNGAPDDIDGLTSDQRFLISYAQVWRQHIRPKALMRRLQEDVHSPGIARVNVGVANLPWWYSAFDIKEGDKNFIAPEKRAKIW
jgi:putative endopeptidase